MQERQFSRFDVGNLTPAEEAVVRRTRIRRARALVATMGTGMLALFAVGCPEPGDLENAGVYPAPTQAGGGGGGNTAGSPSGGGGGSSTGASCETACIKDVFQTQTVCNICHSSALASSGLDLKSDGFTDRLKNVPAKHEELPTDKATCPSGDKLIDPGNPAASWLLKKIDGTSDQCGQPMPTAGSLTAIQKTCMTTYISCVAGGT